MLYLFAAGACLATLLGGLFALHLRDKLHLVLGFSAGAVVGVAFFDLMPEALRLLPAQSSEVFSFIALGFVCYMVVDRFIALHSHTDNDGHEHHRGGFLGAGALSLHSFLDGLGIGFSFKLSAAAGFVVALAVLAHDFSDGINTVNMILKRGGERAEALRWLFVDAFAPILGVAAAVLITLNEAQLGFFLALFAGFFLYIGASDLLPESHHRHPVSWTTLSSVLGMVILYLITRAAL